MSDSRRAVLDRVRTALGSDRDAKEAIEASLDRMRTPPKHPRLTLDQDKADLFQEKLRAVNTGFHRCRKSTQMDAIARCLDDHNLQRQILAAPALRDLDWPSDWQVTFAATRGDDLVAVTPCLTAVAETGSLVLTSSAASPTSLNFLPDYHLVLVEAAQLVLHIEDVWPMLRVGGEPPRTVNFITGPSKTADVEQTIQFGAHGPRSLDVVYIED